MANKTIKVKGSNVSQDSSNRLVTDTEKSTWNGKAAANHTHNNYYSSSTSRTANTVLAAPSGANGAAAFRKLEPIDIPMLTKSKISDMPASMKNPNSIVIKLNGGTTEGTNMFTYDGSSSKSINITAASLGAAASSHTHSQYYDANQERSPNNVLAAPNGSSGKATFRLLQPGDIAGFGNIAANPVDQSTDTPANWWQSRNSVSFITQNNTLVGQPSQYGLLLNINWVGSDCAQMWFTQSCGNVFHRQGNSNGWGGTSNNAGGWALFLDSWNYTNYCLPLTGGTVNGNIGVTGKVSANYMSAYAIDLGNHNEYIYNNNTGNILFRYRESASGSDLYTSIVELRRGIVRMGETLPDGADLNNYLESAVYMLAGTYTHSPVHYGVFITFKPLPTASSFIGQLVIGGSTGYNLFWRFRNESGIWGKWYYSDKKEATGGN